MKYKKTEAVTISQCMIVKNEEKNIQRALSWGKDLMLEQIVVDTGSTDNTVKLAESLGAKVFHYTWNDDFSAAKNYAISLAKGRWIAFLDADEYFTSKEAKRLYQYLLYFEAKRSETPLPQIIRTAIANLNDNGSVIGVNVQDRIFRNISNLRYFGTIHEVLADKDGTHINIIDLSQKLTIFHTGYTSASYSETGKIERNIDMLTKALDKEPENRNLMGYLCESLSVANRTEEALNWGRKALETHGPIDSALIVSAGCSILKLLLQTESEDNDLFLLSYKASINAVPTHPDPEYLMGLYQCRKRNWETAILHLERCMEKAAVYRDRASFMCAGQTTFICNNLVTAHQETSQPAGVVRYGTLSLRTDKYQEPILLAVLHLLRDDPNEKETAAGTISWLSKLYDLDSIKDLLFIYKCAKRLGFVPLEDAILLRLPEEDRKAVSAKTGSEINSAYLTLAAAYPDIPVRNETDTAFLTLMEQISSLTMDELVSSMKNTLDVMSKSSASYQTFIDYFARYDFWGALKPENQVFEVLENRAASLKEHRDDYLWLYDRLADYRSKRVLYAILANWFELDFKHLAQVKEPFTDYFDTDIFPDNHEDVLADIGAYIGDTVQAYVKTYGANYKRIYCYEVTPETIQLLERNTAALDSIEIRQKAVSDGPGSITIEANSQDASANRTDGTSSGSQTDSGSRSNSAMIEVETVALDDDITEPLTFIKMDIEGMEQAALRGCENQIRQNHPKLAICTYHNYEDIWKIPRMIEGMDPSYQFYMRHYGGNLIPTEFVLLAK